MLIWCVCVWHLMGVINCTICFRKHRKLYFCIHQTMAVIDSDSATEIEAATDVTMCLVAINTFFFRFFTLIFFCTKSKPVIRVMKLAWIAIFTSCTWMWLKREAFIMRNTHTTRHERAQTLHKREDVRAASPFPVDKSTKLISFYIINGTINTSRRGSFTYVCDSNGEVSELFHEGIKSELGFW